MKSATHRLLMIALVSAAISGLALADGETIALFNNKDLTGWTAEFSKEGVKMEDVWRVEEGVLMCRGQPSGYLRTQGEYENYVLTLEWLWTPGGKGGNSGVLVHASTPRALGVWPK